MWVKVKTVFNLREIRIVLSPVFWNMSQLGHREVGRDELPLCAGLAQAILKSRDSQ